jgi:uncharacterized protein DUF5985
MAETVYLLCALTSITCAVLLVRSWLRNRTPLLLWSSVSFVGFAINNVLLFVDLVLVPHTDLSVVRAASAFLSVATLLVGLMWKAR